MSSTTLSPKRHREAGFSLIELSILLAVIAIIAVGMLAWLTPPAIDEAERIRVTQQRLKTIQLALTSFRSNFGRLPCPAKRSLRDEDPKNGEEDCTGVNNAVDVGEGAAVTCAGRFNATRKNIGVVPARTLGLGLSVMVDGWGRRFTYHVAEDVCPMETATGTSVNCTSSTYANNNGNIEIRTTNLAGGMTEIADTTPPAGNPASGAVYVLFSHGQNGSCGWLPSGVQKPAFWNPAPSSNTPNNATVASDGEAENIDQTEGLPSIYWKDTYSQTFDDLLIYQT
ncbi:MAG: type II secretion system protein, partial [Alphaproteobacteria bacterium]|nr:type II secretion system protein [Alphaproteobacteria bacterium]